jgi:hypothetical protein
MRVRKLKAALDSVALIFVHVIVTVSVLEAGDVTRSILNLDVGFQNLNVHKLSLCGTGTVGTGKIQGKIAVVSQNEAVHLKQHGRFNLANSFKPQKDNRYPLNTLEASP